MHKTVQNLISIQNNIKNQINDLQNINLHKIIAVSKTFSVDQIIPLIKHGHNDFGENKVQEAEKKWAKIKLDYKNLKLHMIGKLQSNKVKQAVKLFDFIHTVDSKKLAKKIQTEMKILNKNLKIFIQVNIGNEIQKSGIKKEELVELLNYCKDIKLDVVGLMCIPPLGENVEKYFKEMQVLKDELDLTELSMGMSDDYLDAIKYSSTYLRIGSLIFGNRN